MMMSTSLIRSLKKINTKHQGAVLTIGNFDGVHLGHKQLISSVIEKAQTLILPSMVITFEPHPFEFFAEMNLTETGVPRLSRLREKFTALAKNALDFVVILPFNQRIAKMSASDFVSKILYEILRPAHIIVGDDFRFGHKRQGDFVFLHEMGQKLGFSVEAMPTLTVDKSRVSSSRVRQALAQGDHSAVKRLLGHPYTMQGRVSCGHQRGRKLGFPTANIYLHRKVTPIRGVYTVYLHGIAGKALPGVANVGVRPTVDGTRSLLEVHLLNFNQDIYGRYVEVEFCKKLRDEVRYPNIDLLREQIAKDVASAKNYFKKDGVL